MAIPLIGDSPLGEHVRVDVRRARRSDWPRSRLFQDVERGARVIVCEDNGVILGLMWSKPSRFLRVLASATALTLPLSRTADRLRRERRRRLTPRFDVMDGTILVDPGARPDVATALLRYANGVPTEPAV
jgi:hypothetical protein